MAEISVVISVFNGEEFLEECLTSVADFAHEVIVVDHESTDKSVAIAKRFTKKVYHQKNNPQDIDRQKNFGFEKATGDWILSLDADEKVSADLKNEIQGIVTRQTDFVAYRIPRKNIIFGKWIEHTGWYPDYQLRLFQNGKGKYTKKHVHEEMTISGQVGVLANSIEHEAYQTIYQFLHRGLTIYAPNEAEALIENGYEFTFADVLQLPAREFLSRYFAREGYKDGFHGLVLSLLMAFYHFSVFLYVWEKEKFKEDNQSLPLLENETKKIQKEFLYWQQTAKLEKTKNPAQKIFIKTKRKLGL